MRRPPVPDNADGASTYYFVAGRLLSCISVSFLMQSAAGPEVNPTCPSLIRRFKITAPGIATLAAAEADHRHAALWRRFLLCCFVAMFGVRAYCVERFAASIAMVDEWEATGKQVLAAWHQGTFSWAALFQAHNGDHRIVATRLWEILWFELNGAWDPKLIMVVKCLVFAAAGTLFTHLLSWRLPRHRYAFAAMFAALFGFPFGYQNLLWAFQSQFDFFLLAAALGWWALLSGRTGWALVIAALAPFTLGAGPIIAASYLGYGVLAWWNGRWHTRRVVVFGLIAVGVALVGLSLRSSEASPLGPPIAQAYTLLKLLAWPFSNILLLLSQWPDSARLIPPDLVAIPSHDHSLVIYVATLFQAHPAVLVSSIALLAAVMMLPLPIALWSFVTRPAMRTSLFGALCLGGFALLLQIASAIARSTEVMVQTRYIDVVELTGFAAAAAAVALALENARWRRWMIIWAMVVFPGYLATMGASLIQLSRSHEAEWLAAVQPYFPSHNRALMPRNDHWQLPILERDPTAFEELLDDPAVIAILPQSLTDSTAKPRPLAAAVFWIAHSGLMIALVAGGAGWLIVRRAEREDRRLYARTARPAISLGT